MEQQEIQTTSGLAPTENKDLNGTEQALRETERMFQFIGIIGFFIAMLGLFVPFCQFPVSGSKDGWAIVKEADQSVVHLADSLTVANDLAGKVGPGHTVIARPGSWFDHGRGSGVMVFLFCVAGIISLVFRNLFIPLVFAVMTAFMWFLDVTTTYDMIAIAKGTTNTSDTPFRLLYQIFRDALRFGNGAFFVCFGMSLVICAASLAILSQILEPGEEKA